MFSVESGRRFFRVFEDSDTEIKSALSHGCVRDVFYFRA